MKKKRKWVFDPKIKYVYVLGVFVDIYAKVHSIRFHICMRSKGGSWLIFQRVQRRKLSF